jgi:uncharacterized damage-inducible protein DinB
MHLHHASASARLQEPQPGDSVSAPTVTSTFPTGYAAIPTAKLIEVYAAGPSRLRVALAGLDPFEWTARPRPNKWSIVEIALHMTDSELIGTGRSRLTFAQPGKGYFTYDENGWAAAFDYQGASESAVERSLTLFEALRAYQLPVFQKATSSQWLNEGQHPQWGAVTLRNLLELYADHSERHIGQILENRRLLGRAVELPVVLPERLY